MTLYQCSKCLKIVGVTFDIMGQRRCRACKFGESMRGWQNDLPDFDVKIIMANGKEIRLKAAQIDASGDVTLTSKPVSNPMLNPSRKFRPEVG